MAEEIKKKGYGRKPGIVITEEMMLEITALSKRGLRQCHIYNYFGMDQKTWQEKCKRNPEIIKAYWAGKSKGIDVAATKLMEQVEKGNMDAIKFFLKSVGKYFDVPNQESSEEGEQNQPNQRLTINVTDPIEAAKIYQEIMKGSPEK